MELWFSDYHTEKVKVSVKVQKQLFGLQTEFQRIDVFDSDEFGRFLSADGSIVFSEKDEFIYDEMVVPMRNGIAIALATGKNPQAVTMSFQKEYAERYDWLVKEFSDWAFTFTTSFLYYLDYDRLDEQTKNLYRQGMSAFGGISPTYHIALAENAPVIVWNFHSLLVMIQMCFSFMLTDSDCDMKLCKHCGRAFIASRKGNEFCSPKCKNQYNVYKTRARKKRNNSHIPTKTANYQQLVDDLPSLIFYYFVNDIYAIAGSFFTIFSISDMLFSETV